MFALLVVWLPTEANFGSLAISGMNISKTSSVKLIPSKLAKKLAHKISFEGFSSRNPEQGVFSAEI